jgi:hypothetical protein
MAGYIIYSLDWGKFRQLVERPTPDQLAALGRLLSDGLGEYDGEFDEDDPVLTLPTDVGALAQIAAKRLGMPDWYGDLSTRGKNLWEGVVFNACMNCDDIDVGFRVDNDGVYWDVIELAWKHLGVVPGQISSVALSAFGKRPYRYQAATKMVKTRHQHDSEEQERQSSLKALSGMLGKFLRGVKQGQLDPNSLLEELDQHGGVSEQHKKALKGLLSDEDSDENDSDESEDWEPMHSMHTPDEVQKMLAELQSLESPMQKTKKKNVRQQHEDDLLPAIASVAGESRMLFVQVDT